MARVLECAVRDARALADGGADALIVENFGDAPFFAGSVPPETVAGLALAIAAVIDAASGVPVGVNVLRNDARAAIGLCAATGAQFVRINVHTGAAATDQGLIEGRAAETLRERARLCPGVAILADVHVKHATPLSHSPIGVTARETLERGLADGLVVSGVATGSAPLAADVRAVKEAAGSSPVLIGSGLEPQNAKELLAHADGAIVGTALKRDGFVANEVDRDRVARLRALFDSVRRIR